MARVTFGGILLAFPRVRGGIRERELSDDFGIFLFSIFSSPGSRGELFSGTPQYVGPQGELLRWPGVRDRQGAPPIF